MTNNKDKDLNLDIDTTDIIIPKQQNLIIQHNKDGTIELIEDKEIPDTDESNRRSFGNKQVDSFIDKLIPVTIEKEDSKQDIIKDEDKPVIEEISLTKDELHDIEVSNRDDKRGSYKRKILDGIMKGKTPKWKQDNPLIHAKLLGAASIGANVTELCLAAGISRATYFRILKEHPDVSEEIKQLKSVTALTAKMKFARALKNDEVDPHTLLKYLGVADPDNYAAKQTIAIEPVQEVKQISTPDKLLLESVMLDD